MFQAQFSVHVDDADADALQLTMQNEIWQCTPQEHEHALLVCKAYCLLCS